MLSLRNSLIVIFVLLVAGPLAAFWAWPHSQALQNEIDEVKDRHLLIARNLGAALQRYHRDTTTTFDYVTESLLQETNLPDTRQLLANLRFKSICVFDATSRQVIRGHAGTAECADAIAAKSHAEFLELAVEGRTILAPVHANRHGEPVVCWLRKAGDRLVIGVIDTRYFVELGRSISFGIKGHAVIVDQRGKVLAHPFPAWEAEMRDLSKISAVRAMLEGQTGITTFYSPAFKDEMIVGYTAVSGPGWGVMVPQPISEIREMARRIQSSALSIFAMCLLAAALIACRAAMTLLHPVHQVIAAASAMADGGAEARIAPPGRLAPREFSTLTATFNAMAEKIATARQGEAEAREAAERANRSKSEFLRTVTHELRSPLNAIVGFAEMLTAERHGPIGVPAYKSCAEDIRSGSKLLLSLTNDLLDLARIEAGEYEIADDVVDLGIIAARAVRFVATAAAGRDMRLIVSVASDLSAVRGDERALFQCVLNLVSNAVRYGRSGGTIAVRASSNPTGGILLVVEDDGPGIDPVDLERVLLPFQRVANAANREISGSGLGLPIVKRLAELHDGSFTLESTLGAGTRAQIVLPPVRVIADDPAGKLDIAA